MTHETVDEIIDRVAAEMTAVSADPAFADRVSSQLDRRRPGLLPALVIAAAVSTVVLVAVVWPPREPPTPVSRELTIGALAPVAPLPPAAYRDAPARSEEGGTRVTRRAGQRIPTPEVERADRAVSRGTAVEPLTTANVAVADPAIAGPEPPPLIVAELTIAQVVRPDAVAIAPLEIAPLEVPELGIVDEPQEEQ